VRRITNVSSGSNNLTAQSKYKIDGVAGKGTFGTVFLAHVRGDGGKVAIKKVFLDKRYKNRELQILKVLRNPFVLEMRDYFITYDGEREYLNVVMDFFHSNLYQMIKKK
jgi:serine/threonine protein kinase